MAIHKKTTVLFFGRRNCELSARALEQMIDLDFIVTACLVSSRDEVFPEAINQWRGDYIFSFRNLSILPASILNNAKIAAINFHPGSTGFPGSAGLNYALYEDSVEYGVTAHLMTERVDEGVILECRRFPVYEKDNVDTLLGRTHIKLLDIFMDFIAAISVLGVHHIENLKRISKDEKWAGRKRTIKELNKLSIVDVCSSEEQFRKIMRATNTKNYPTEVLLHGHIFSFSKKHSP